jgi:glycosyltransferase involved in cell wall biosynthesis
MSIFVCKLSNYKGAINMPAKPKVLTFVSYYLPGYKSGGQARTIANMVDQLGDEVDFLIVTSDRDMLETKPYSDVDIDQWNVVGKAKVFYASPEVRSFKGIKRIIKDTEHDLIYLNSFFDTIFSIYPILARRLNMLAEVPIVIAPRGEFSEGALALKLFKKKVYIIMAKMLRFYNGLTWQASSVYEEADIRHSIGGSTARKIFVAPDLPQKYNLLASLRNSSRKKDDPIRIVFLSRISPKKNLDYAIRVLKEVEVPVIFNIYGVIDDSEYWDRCRQIIETLPANIAVKFHGPIEHEKVVQVLAKNDLFFFPTLGENYGHVIYEALIAGVPVLISDQTPWRNLKKDGVGWDVSLSKHEEFRNIIEECASLSEEERLVQKELAAKYAARVSADNQVVKSNLNLFAHLIYESEVANV